MKSDNDLKAWFDRIEAIRHSAVWSADEQPIEKIQTHISVLLLGRHHVLKFKKPVDFGFLDYTTLEKRKIACENEVRLNRRLCPDTYLGVEAFHDASGAIIEYAVRMKRLPEARMLDKLVERGEVREAMIEEIAARLLAFHRTAARGPEISRWGSLAEIRHNWEENFAQTRPFIDRTIRKTDFELVQDRVAQWLSEKADRFARRIEQGKIVDGHGDVRCESICVGEDAICIYDCIEFNDRFRCDDVASEVAFLAMDLDARGRPDLGYFFAEEYARRSDDEALFGLLPFYKCYRAYVRGKVLSFRLDEPEFSEAERAQAQARAAAFFELSRRYATPLQQPMLIVVGGLSGTGKTAVARALASELGLRVLSADAIRAALFGAAKHPAAYGAGAYTATANRNTYDALLAKGREILARGDSVILDATFRHAEDRHRAEALAKELSREFRLLECRAPEDIVRERLARRAVSKEGESDADWKIYLQQREAGDTICPPENPHCLVVETAGPLPEVARNAADWLRRSAL